MDTTEKLIRALKDEQEQLKQEWLLENDPFMSRCIALIAFSVSRIAERLEGNVREVEGREEPRL